MKALILAAGYGTRLLPHTQHVPKALFPIAGQPLIDIMIRQLIREGFSEIMVNTHHLHSEIDAYIQCQNYPVPIFTRFEEKILGTGGAIKNVSDFLGNQPFLVINSDILCDINLRAVCEYHRHHPNPVTLVMHDYPVFNNVWIDVNGYVASFNSISDKAASSRKCLAFTGIQIVSPMMMDFIPANTFITSIEIYKNMIEAGHKIKTYISKNHYWRDIGSPESYMAAVFEKTAPLAFLKAFGEKPPASVSSTHLAGDGSDRKWHRVFSGDKSLVMADHGIKTDDAISEITSFIAIGRHLFTKGVPVPEIYYHDVFAGLVFLQDLGDTSLQMAVRNEKNENKIITLYKAVIDELLHMSISGADCFDPLWAYQTPAYSKEMILERECRYFTDALLNGYLNMGISFDALENEFSALADLALKYAVLGFMHRDFQSRNIMVQKGRIYFIDFQGGRIGPLQYDLASLLHDPYVDLSESVKTDLMLYCLNKLQTWMKIDESTFVLGYRYCTITRLLQALGAYGFLSRVKQKAYFETYIPVALNNLKNQLEMPEFSTFKLLRKTVEEAQDIFFKQQKPLNRKMDPNESN